MPPPRRRPVQPATRVRLPRSARPGSAPAAHDDTAPAESPELLAGQVQTEAAPPGDVAAGDVAAAQAQAGETFAEPAGAGPDEVAADGGWLEDADGEPDGLDGAVADVAEPAEKTPPAAADERHPMLWPACLGALAVTLGSLAIWFGVAASSTGNGVDTQNTALTDAAATAQVNQQIDKAFTTIFSYNYADTAKTLRAARSVLTGKAVGEYASLFRVVEQDAPKEKLVLTTTVTNSGVERLTGDTARVLIFANQRDTSASHQTTDSGAVLAINAVQVNGQWKIASIDAFSGG